MPQTVFALTQDPEWRSQLEEYFAETAARFFCFADEGEWRAECEPWSLGIIEASCVKKPALYHGFPFLKLGPGEPKGVTPLGRLDLPVNSPEFHETLMRAFPSAGGGLLTILLIDDDAEFTAEMKRSWEAKRSPRTRVETALHGLEGLEMARRTAPDVVITDIKMPVMSGIEFYRKFRSEDRRTPVLVLSAVGDAEEIVRIRQAGDPAWIEKSAGESLPDPLWRKALKLKVFGSRDLR